MDDDLLDLIQGMLKHDPSERYTIAQILEHAWCQGTMATPEEMHNHHNGIRQQYCAAQQAQEEDNARTRQSYMKTITANRRWNERMSE